MPLFPVVSDKVSFVAGAVAPTDTNKNGFRWAGDLVLAELALTPVTTVQGVPVDVDGKVCLIDATLGLPVGTTYTNGLPLSAGMLCISTNSMATYSNGVPMSALGGVCV